MNDASDCLAQLYDLAGAHCEGRLTAEQSDRLQELVIGDEELRRRYIIYTHIHALAELGRCLPASEPDGGSTDVTGPHAEPPLCRDVSAASSPVPGFLSGITYGTVGYFTSGWPLAYLTATVILAIALVIGALTPVSQPVQVARQSVSLPSPLSPLPSIVGRITGMVDCKWETRSGVRGQGSETEDHQSSMINHQSLVSLGDRFVLASGLVEITYDSGARVILQGPVRYEVESAACGFLSIGKLTARVEGRGARDEGATIQRSAFSVQRFSNPQSLIPNLALSTIHSPLFTIRTPTATVTDLGTEFGVEVKPDQTTEISVLRGVVETERLVLGGVPGEKRRVVAGEAVRCEPRKKSFTVLACRPETFVQSLQPIEDSGEFTGLRLSKRWTFNTPNAGNHWSLTARRGFLRMKLYNACQNAWEDRGTAPVLYTAMPSPPNRFSMETYVDLATGNGGKSKENTIGGLAVYDAARDDFSLTFGLAHNPPDNPSIAVREVALQSPEKDHARVPLEADSAWLKLERDGSVWRAYYKTTAEAAWTLAGEAREADFSRGIPTDPRVGLFAKTFNARDPGGRGANIDFDYFRIRNPDQEAAK